MVPRLLLFCAAFLVGPHLGLAQSLSAAPRGGVFGAADEGGRSRLDLTMAVSEALDSEAPPELRSVVQQGGPQSGGHSSMLTTSADYARTRRRTQIAGTAFMSFRYYPQFDRVSSMNHSAALGAAVNLPRRATVEVRQTADYSPSYLFRLFPAAAPPALGEAVPPAQDYRVDLQRSFSSTTSATVAAGSTRGSRASVTVDWNKTQFSQASANPNLDVLSGRAKWSRGLGRTGALSAEYEYRAGQFGYGGNATEQRVRIGGELSPALSISRRAVFRFSVAPSVLEIPESTSGVLATGTLYRLEWDASAKYPFSLGWSFGGSYRRGVEYVAVLREPVFSDAAGLELAGLISRRLDVSASAGYAVGRSALTRASQRFDTYTGTVRARYALMRSFALYADYLYYYYDLRGQRALAPELRPVFEQQGVRLGVMVWSRPLGR